MSKSAYPKIIKLLLNNKTSYKLLKHQPVYTSEQAAKVRGSSLKAGAKALIFLADNKPIMIVVPGNKKVNVRKFKDAYKIKNLAMATPDEVEKITEGVKIGAVHPFGNLHNLPVYVDQSLGRNKEIVFNAGVHDRSIKMEYRDYYRLVKPKLGKFAMD
jgi:Ala-tRNA(Pro) deacylase